MTKVPVPVTYRIEERDPAGAVLQEWHRGIGDRDEALKLFRILVIGDHEDGWGLNSSGRRRLVMVAVPPACRHCGEPIELVDGGRRWRHLHTDTITGTRHQTCGHDGELGSVAAPAGVTW